MPNGVRTVRSHTTVKGVVSISERLFSSSRVVVSDRGQTLSSQHVLARNAVVDSPVSLRFWDRAIELSYGRHGKCEPRRP